jgi:hypothetical protein
MELIMGNCFERNLDLDCCHCESPFNPDKRICCDGDENCRRFDEECRDCFWPNFSHPTWLCCDILYGCCRKEHENIEGAR